MRLPTLVPTTRSTGIRSCSSTRNTPMWAKPRAAPPPRTSATFGSGPGVAAAGGACGGGAVGSGGVAVRQAARRRTARAKARRIEAPWRSPSVTAGRPGSRRAAEISRKIDRLPPISHRRRNMPQVIQSMELAQVLAEAADIAASVSQKLTSAHQLLAFFTVPNRAEILLRERGVDEDRILAAMTAKPKEPDAIERDLRERAREVAESVGSQEVDCLHLLIAMSRVRASLAHQLLTACGLQLPTLRNLALSYFTARMPRRLKEVQPVKVGPSAQQVSSGRRSSSARPATPEDAQAAAESLRALDAQLEQAMEELETAAGIDGEAARSESATTAPSPPPSPPLRGGEGGSATPSSTARTSGRPEHPERSAAGGGAESKGSRAATAAAAAVRARRSPHALDPKEFPWLSQLGRNLTELAAQGKLDPLVGREREVEEAIDVLGKRRTNNPLLVGEPGVGKTAIVEGIAQRLVDGITWDEICTRGGAAIASGGPLGGRVLVEIDMASVVAGTQLRGSFSEKLLGIKDEVRRAAGRVVVFIDEIHTIMGAGATGASRQEAANEL